MSGGVQVGGVLVRGVRVEVGGGQGGFERRIEVFVKIKKNLWGGGSGFGFGGGVRMDVNEELKFLGKFTKTRFDVYVTLCPQQMLVHKGGQIKNWSGECRDVIPTKLQCKAIQRALQSSNLQREIIRKK